MSLFLPAVPHFKHNDDRISRVNRGYPNSGVIAQHQKGRLRREQCDPYVLLVNSKFLRKYFKLRVETCTNDRLICSSKPDSIADAGLISLNLDSGPKLNVRSNEPLIFRSNERTSTESGIQTKPDKFGGTSNNSRRCDGDENVKLVIRQHASKQKSPTYSTDEGRDTDVIDEQHANARSPTNSTDEGRTIDLNDEEHENALWPSRTSRESRGNGEFASPSHEKKQPVPRIVTDEGTVMDSSKKHSENAQSGILSNSEPAAKETAPRNEQPSKQPSPRNTTDDGISIVFRA
jgi:hypothetical protein